MVRGLPDGDLAGLGQRPEMGLELLAGKVTETRPPYGSAHIAI
jgi:hypothetical protein